MIAILECLLEKQLATVELTFLAGISTNKKKNSLFLLFNWLTETEKKVVGESHLQLLLLNDHQIFYKAKGCNTIGIYHNQLPFKPVTNKQLLVLCQSFPRNKLESDNFTSALMTLLQENRMEYQTTSIYNEICLSGHWQVVQALTVSMAVP